MGVLTCKTALITGAARGIGFAIAKAFIGGKSWLV
jgi:NAD(P)-dependent dehydrogenase (short-subunit alcohol dehydrogenase family)